MGIGASWGHMELPFWETGSCRGSAMAPLERAMVVSYRLSIVTVALTVTIRLQFAIKCLRRSNQQGGWVTDIDRRFKHQLRKITGKADAKDLWAAVKSLTGQKQETVVDPSITCLLYTSDAADE